MLLTSDYQKIWATLQSEVKYSQEPRRSRWSDEYYFTIGPLEYRVQFHVYRQGSDIYVMMFKPSKFNGSLEEKAAFYEKVTGVPVDEYGRLYEDIPEYLDDWFDSEKSLKLTGTGSSFQVMSNVVSTINRFLKEKESSGRPVHCLIFQADKEEESRVRIYSRIANMYKSQGFTVEQKPDGGYIEFNICRAD
jgi:hypothetical protein